MKKKDIRNWMLVSSIIALLILTYVIVAFPKSNDQLLQEIPLTETSNSGDEKAKDNSKDKQNDQSSSDKPKKDDNKGGPGSDDNDQQDNGDDQGDDSNGDDQNNNDNKSHCPPMKHGLHKPNHKDNASDKANEHRYTCNGRAVGNPFHE